MTYKGKNKAVKALFDAINNLPTASSGGGFTKKMLYDSATSAAGTLSDPLTGYDLVVIETYYMYSGRKIISTEWLIVADMINDETKAWYQCGVIQDCTITFSGKTFTVHTGAQLVNRIWGVKF